MQSYFDFLWSENEFTDFLNFQIFSLPFPAWINEMKAKSRNVKIQFESLRNKSVTISNNLWFFLIALRLTLRNLKM